MAKDVVCVGWYATSIEAHMAHGLLEAEGIPSIVSGAFALDTARGEGPMEARLEVPTEHAERARAILERPATCPTCGVAAVVVHRERPPRVSGWRALLRPFEAPIVRRVCSACGSEVKDEEEDDA